MATSSPEIAGFEWDEGNRAKCAKHGVSLAEIENLFQRPVAVVPDPAHSQTEQRLKAIGESHTGRMILVVFTLRRRGMDSLIRPISARYMHQKEIDYYEKAIAHAQQR
jgi:uncharacterized DUF497 family protein